MLMPKWRLLLNHRDEELRNLSRMWFATSDRLRTDFEQTQFLNSRCDVSSLKGFLVVQSIRNWILQALRHRRLILVGMGLSLFRFGGVCLMAEV
jgi:hypothetical protein